MPILVLYAVLILVGVRTYYRHKVNKQRREAGLPPKDWKAKPEP